MSHMSAPQPLIENLISSPLSETNTVDSGTSSLSNNVANDAVVDDDDTSTGPDFI